MRDNEIVNFNQPFTFEEAYNYLVHVDPTVIFVSFDKNNKYLDTMINMRENNDILEPWVYDPFPVPIAFPFLDKVSETKYLYNKIYYIKQSENILYKTSKFVADGVIDCFKTFTEKEFEDGNMYISNYIHDALGNQTGMRLVKDLRNNEKKTYTIDYKTTLYAPVIPTHFYRVYEIKKYNFIYRLPDIYKDIYKGEDNYEK